MTFFTPKPVGDFLTGSETRNAMPWRARHETSLTRVSWSVPYSVICTGESAGECEGQARAVLENPLLLILAIGEAHLAVGLKGEPNTWYQTLIVQKQVDVG